MKKIIFVIFVGLFLSGCFQVVALVGPALTGATSGNIYQSALSYSLSYGVKKRTGKTIIENVIDINKDHKEEIRANREKDILVNSFSSRDF
jgi:outer membrane lipoprotein-sorting protein